MLTSFTIKNFRCFRDLTLKPLERVNLIAGANNVGKTALLEALWLHHGPNNPELPARIQGFRGFERLTGDGREMWGWLFFCKRTEEAIELSSQSEGLGRRCLQIRLAEPEVLPLGSTGDGDEGASPGFESLMNRAKPAELILEYQDELGQKGISRLFFTLEGGKIEGRMHIAPLPSFPPGVFLSARTRFLGEDVERFSNLERVGRQDEILSALRIIEPRLRRLAVLITGGVPLINGDIGMGELMPLPVMGEGMSRLLSLLLAIANAPHGTVLIDEIENGLHYSVMVKVWQAIADAARRADAQVFATTHSWECLQAAHEAFRTTGTYDFRFHRLDRIDSEIRAVTFDQEMLATAIATDLEVR